ncbi:MAG: hypothetical protein SGJ23_05770 [Alphaproteobacteria bacterium]|nr:hypothetical protein [Alphaproteobacteria bacterium]
MQLIRRRRHLLGHRARRLGRRHRARSPGLADRSNDGEISTEVAIIEARAKIETETRRALPPSR